jgi:hypothetical protein
MVFLGLLELKESQFYTLSPTFTGRNSRGLVVSHDISICKYGRLDFPSHLIKENGEFTFEKKKREAFEWLAKCKNAEL